MDFCTSDACKSVVLLFAFFIAAYLVVTNSRNNTRELFDVTGNVVTGDVATVDILPADAHSISTVYKDIYFADITEELLKKYVEEWKGHYVTDEFRRVLTQEREYDVSQEIIRAYHSVYHRNPTPREASQYLDQFMTGQIKS